VTIETTAHNHSLSDIGLGGRRFAIRYDSGCPGCDSELRCKACDADAADIGTFDHGIAHTLGESCIVPRWAVDACARTGNHDFHGAA